MKPFAVLLCLLLSSPLFAIEKHILMVSDSRGNCAFAHQMMRNFYTMDKTNFRMVSVGGSSPSTWVDAKKRFVSPYGLDLRGSSDLIPEKFPKALALRKIKTPYFPDLLKQEAEGKEKFLTIINLGTNASNIKELKVSAIKMIKEVHLRNSSCVWVSPPHAQGFPLKHIQNQTSAIKEAIAEAGRGPEGENCQLINSLEITQYPFTHRASGIDGVHYCWNPKLIELGQNWAKDAFEQFKDF